MIKSFELFYFPLYPFPENDKNDMVSSHVCYTVERVSFACIKMTNDGMLFSSLLKHLYVNNNNNNKHSYNKFFF